MPKKRTSKKNKKLKLLKFNSKTRSLLIVTILVLVGFGAYVTFAGNLKSTKISVRTIDAQTLKPAKGIGVSVSGCDEHKSGGTPSSGYKGFSCAKGKHRITAKNIEYGVARQNINIPKGSNIFTIYVRKMPRISIHVTNKSFGADLKNTTVSIDGRCFVNSGIGIGERKSITNKSGYAGFNCAKGKHTVTLKSYRYKPVKTQINVRTNQVYNRNLSRYAIRNLTLSAIDKASRDTVYGATIGISATDNTRGCNKYSGKLRFKRNTSVTFSCDVGSYYASVKAPSYEGIAVTTIKLNSSRYKAFVIKRNSFNITFRVIDASTGAPINRAAINLKSCLSATVAEHTVVTYPNGNSSNYFHCKLDNHKVLVQKKGYKNKSFSINAHQDKRYLVRLQKR